jgi:hypothetical protein
MSKRQKTQQKKKKAIKPAQPRAFRASWEKEHRMQTRKSACLLQERRRMAQLQAFKEKNK